MSFSASGKRTKATGVATEVQACLEYDPQERVTAQELLDRCKSGVFGGEDPTARRLEAGMEAQAPPRAAPN